MIIKKIQAGELHCTFSEGESRLDELLAFASRENHKRGFLFVSKVLGKHIPVKPSQMRAIYNELATLCHLKEAAYVLGMSETATGLGAGVADSLARQHPDLAVYYQHTTRHQLDKPLWFSLNESHSHAMDHLLYEPKADIKTAISQVSRLILVDDEISTGRTLLQLALGVIKKIPTIQNITIVTLVSWLKESDLAPFQDLDISVEFIQLMKGEFDFIADPDFTAQLPDHIDKALCTQKSIADLGRLGLKMPYQLTPADIPNISDPVVVVGTGEHLYYPFLVAEALSQITDVLFQSTTRSPILEGDAIQRKISFDNGAGKQHFIYNLPKERRILVLGEYPNAPEYGLVTANEH